MRPDTTHLLHQIQSKMKVEFLFAWYDFWIGLYLDRWRGWLYICPVPMFGIVIKFLPKHWKVREDPDGFVVFDTMHAKQLSCAYELESDAYEDAWRIKRALKKGLVKYEQL